MNIDNNIILVISIVTLVIVTMISITVLKIIILDCANNKLISNNDAIIDLSIVEWNI